jgi:4-hydroxy-tetrahydrodipicolinate synthase
MALGFMAMAASGASRSPPTSRRACAPNSRTPAWPATGGRALELQDRLYPLHAALFSDASPGPVKYAVNRVRPDFPPIFACR